MTDCPRISPMARDGHCNLFPSTFDSLKYVKGLLNCIYAVVIYKSCFFFFIIIIIINMFVLRTLN